MPGIFIVLIIVVLIVIAVFFQVMVKIGVAGINPSKLISDILKKKTDETDDIELRNKLRENVTIQRWRVTAGILFGIDILFLWFFSPALLSSYYPWAHCIFWPLLIVTVIVFIILRKKEQKFKKENL